MLTRETAERFVAEWYAAWNARDLDRILALWVDECVFTSPLAVKLLGTNGVVKGKQALRAYWTKGLAASPGLHFEPLGLYLGVSSLVMHYRNQNGRLSAEEIRLDAQGKACEGRAHHSE
jgi:hypothetical protein